MLSYFNPLTPKERLLIALCICIVMALLLSCNSQKKALQKVLTNIESFNKVGAKWAELNPCVNTETLTFINGDTITITQRDTLIDMQVINDTVTTYYEVTNTITKIKKDTVKYTVIDGRGLAIIKDSLIVQKQVAARLYGIIDQMKVQDKVDGKHKLFMGLVIALLALIIGILIRLKFF